MHRKISDEEKRLRSINTYVVLFVFFIMVSAGVICVLIFNILDAFGLIKHIEVVPMLLPFIMLCLYNNRQYTVGYAIGYTAPSAQ